MRARIAHPVLSTVGNGEAAGEVIDELVDGICGLGHWNEVRACKSCGNAMERGGVRTIETLSDERGMMKEYK